MTQAKSWTNLVAIILLGAVTVTTAVEPQGRPLGQPGPGTDCIPPATRRPSP